MFDKFGKPIKIVKIKKKPEKKNVDELISSISELIFKQEDPDSKKLLRRKKKKKRDESTLECVQL